MMQGFHELDFVPQIPKTLFRQLIFSNDLHGEEIGWFFLHVTQQDL